MLPSHYCFVRSLSGPFIFLRSQWMSSRNAHQLALLCSLPESALLLLATESILCLLRDPASSSRVIPVSWKAQGTGPSGVGGLRSRPTCL